MLEIFLTRAAYNRVDFDKQAEKKPNLLVESAKLEVSRPESSPKNYEEQEQEQEEDKETHHHFGLDLELPHPDHYLPETG